MVNNRKNETLDPENWDEFSELGHQMLDDMVNFLKTMNEKYHTFATEEQKAAIYKPLSREGVGEERAYNEFVDNMLPSLIGPKASRF